MSVRGAADAGYASSHLDIGSDTKAATWRGRSCVFKGDQRGAVSLAKRHWDLETYLVGVFILHEVQNILYSNVKISKSNAGESIRTTSLVVTLSCAGTFPIEIVNTGLSVRSWKIESWI